MYNNGIFCNRKIVLVIEHQTERTLIKFDLILNYIQLDYISDERVVLCARYIARWLFIS